jgi:hypothetical protein
MAIIRNISVWLTTLSLGYQEVNSLYCAIKNESKIDSFECKRQSNGLFITAQNNNDTLVIPFDQKDILLNTIEKQFCEGMSVDNYYLFYEF